MDKPRPGPDDALGADYLERNRAAWEAWAPMYASRGRNEWREDLLRWGIWGLPESGLQLLESVRPGDDVIELGCGTGSLSAWLARRGARPVAVDFAPAQLDMARQLQREFDVVFPLLCANAEDVDLEDVSFDLAVSEYGASLWCEPRRWIAETHRLLRPSGRLIFLTTGAMLMACSPPDGGVAGEQLLHSYFVPSRVDFGGQGPVEFHLTHGDWIRLLRATGFVLEDLIEVRPPPDAEGAFDFVTLEWARRWPSEEIWVARKTP
jgi:SAM-dependent methyltransferase